MTIAERDPATQYQIGDAVVYMPEGVVSIVSGYVWSNLPGALPMIAGYTLLAGCTVPAETLRRATAGVDYGREGDPATQEPVKQ